MLLAGIGGGMMLRAGSPRGASGFVFLISLLSTCLLFSSCTPKAPPPPLEKVTVAVPANLYGALFFVAREKGFFREEGLDVALTLHPYGKVALDNMVSGGADFAVSAETPVMFTILKGGDVLVVATVLESVKDLTIIAMRRGGVEASADLRGKRVGAAAGTNGAYFLDTFLVVNGIPRESVKILNLKPDDLRDAFKAGKIDAASIWNPYGADLRKEFGADAVTFYGENIYIVSAPLTVRREFTRSRPTAVRRLLRSLLRADEFARKDPAAAVEITARGIGADRQTLQQVWPLYEIGVKLDQSFVINMENQARWAIRNRLVSAKVVPDFLNHVHVEALKAEKPEAVTVSR
jgi:sulfonate transport system substrate-binding protein